MRGYISITANELHDWLKQGSAVLENLYAPTADFVAENSDLDEEELEFTLSMLAAQDSLADESEKFPLVAALEVPSALIASSSEGVITLKESAAWSSVECVFLVEDGGEELTWYATQEVEDQLKNWLS
ncbi:unannotated protein [freshwater metagenome]|uniref:Unannotated protein n=1 Tax=freshwater metagenome TaxID=449393 RepID=A0A6J7DK64_9ZZZZ|nr:hypothetical protein [Actinomycetota bacterium]